MSTTEVTETADQDVAAALPTDSDAIYAPNVDICENGGCLRLMADMPGVDQSAVDVTVENNVLTIEGRASIAAPEGYEPLGREYAVGKYRRDFTLSNAVDTEGIKARVRHGVLELTIPKREEVKLRKIEIGA